MSANKKASKGEQPVELTGKVVIKKFGADSKSEHNAVYLETEQGEYVLRKVGGNPFYDASLHKLEGKTVTAKGVISDYLFLATDIKEREK